jgi:hypothetical protein
MAGAAPREVRMLTAALGKIHGDVDERNEKRGWHIYLTCPRCLEREGRRALRS